MRVFSFVFRSIDVNSSYLKIFQYQKCNDTNDENEEIKIHCYINTYVLDMKYCIVVITHQS